MGQWFKTLKSPTFICSGNHDIELLEREDWLSEIDSDYVYPNNGVYTYRGIQIGYYPYIGGEGYFGYDKRNILLYHVPPANTKTSILQNEEDWDDENLYHALVRGVIKPKAILSGHVHSPKDFKDTIKHSTVYNPGYSPREVPSHHSLTLSWAH